ncbi:2-succinyl-5-enolpyruvyl-6-hydroxy-3-cyclohexene-1- carboxylate synthase [Croceitalea dokdonensis DOKDO 023]|uniref:2-succinyl-5-enolpyruvyl-6-hydroxy-3-cyclohexene-1-carboxylate synthase n=1 Tax=Croceitalea dokdonensis DOKDO 023 TaxID=1300341 RepID=A0A0P7AMS9_9FLAO|nr:2-succinyl-5-enolpyruvyl-6-hydroxy-3-cyclohexene-1-carboxylic-acid synthase [Croceitalea dokdonensis]KPM33213.1 2-succinyl-5-enolpyruvyl-6-hydroxy-3-cyclohexene-1- carboxylate synthase [Croceitalea dokdonensis DOKDO 023]
MKQSVIPSAKMVVAACKSKGIRDIVISPGSRNAPLTLSFSKNTFFNCYSIVDERSAAFFALGMSQQQKRPVALVCTSGSALLNYYPAIAEAFYSTIPLIVISADRPPYKIDVGDGQTIRQDNVFQRHIGYSANLKLDVSHAVGRIERYAPYLLQTGQSKIERYNRKELNQAFNVAFMSKLPVHINVPFEEPLYDLEEGEHLDFNSADTKITSQEPLGFEEDLGSLKQLWRKAGKKMVLVGVNHPNTIERELIERLGNDASVVVFTETTSNLHHPNFFPSIDSIIFPIEKSEHQHKLFKELQPDILLTFGGLVVSKKVKAFLRNYTPKQHWHIDGMKALDTYFCLSKHFRTNPNAMLKILLSETDNSQSDYFKQWHQVKRNYERKRAAYLKQIGFSDFLVFDILLSTIPDKYQVHLANSSTVRYAQLFDMNPTLGVFCNRGTSGIDGSTSTAVGGAIYDSNPTVLISGDLSFFYDSNALWNSYLRKDFRIIIINNSGGGIFRILPGNDGSDTFETYFETVQSTNAYHLCKQFGLMYKSANDTTSLRDALHTFYDESDYPKVLEIFTPRKINDKILLGYFDFIS